MESSESKKTDSKKRRTKVQTMYFTEILNIIKFRRKFLYILPVLTMLGTMINELQTIPTYQASTQLIFEQKDKQNVQAILGMGLSPQNLLNQNHMQKYIDYFNSNAFFLELAENLKFHESYTLLKLTTQDEMSTTQKKFWINFIKTYFGKDIADDTEKTIEPILIPVEQLAQTLRSFYNCLAVGPNGIKITTKTFDPTTSVILVNLATDLMLKKAVEKDHNDVTEVKKFVEKRLEDSMGRLKKSEIALVEFKKDHRVRSLNPELSEFNAKLTAIETELETTKLQLQENNQLIEHYSKSLAKTESSIMKYGSSALRSTKKEEVQRFRAQLEFMQNKKKLMQAQGYAEDSLQMSEVNKDIDKIVQNLRQDLQTTSNPKEDSLDFHVDLDLARGKLAALKNTNSELEPRISKLENSRNELMKGLGPASRTEHEYLTLKRDVDLQFELYSTLRKKLQELDLQQISFQSEITTGDRPEIAQPTQQTILLTRMIFSFLVGIFFGCILALFFEAIDPTVKHLSDLEELEVESFGAIPHVDGSPIRRRLGGLSYRPDLLITREKPESPESMAFKHIRAQMTLLRAHDGKPAKVFTITSPERGDGKTFLAANLAISLSQLEKRVVLVDCDFRNPSQPLLFGYKRDTDGLGALLTLQNSLDECLLRERMPGLDLLPAGWSPENPTEMISNEKLRILIEHLKSAYDYIILDTPPLIALIDACILSNLSDAVVLTATFRKTKKDSVLQALQKITQVTHKPTYSILNNVYERHEYASYYIYQNESGAQIDHNDEADIKLELARFEKSLTKRKAS